MTSLSGGTRRNLLHRLAVGALVVLAFAALAPPAARAASLVVNTLADELNSDGDCSLREAITAANTNAAVDACPAGSATVSDTITFSVGGTIVLGSMLPKITDVAGLTIDGAGQAVTISGNNAVKVMRIERCATLNLRDLTIADGYASSPEPDTGARSAIMNGGTLTLTNTTVSNNTSTSCCGGGIENDGLLTVTGSTFSGNRPDAIISGGNVNNLGEVNIIDSTFSGNRNAVRVSFDTARIVNSTFSNNVAAISNDRGTVTITRSTFTGNVGSVRGAIINASSRMTITDSTFSGNRANSGSTDVRGGAIYSEGTASVLAIANSTFVNNSAAGLNGARGGAISVNSGTVTVNNSTFSGNHALAYYVSDSGWGGAIYTQGTGSVNITHSTFLNNYALEEGSSSTKGDAGDAIRNADARVAVTLRNTLVARYIPEQETRNGWPLAPLLNCSGPITDGGGNLQFNYWNPADATCPGLGADPLLDPAGVQDNGGPTDTIGLLAGSPAIDAGVDATCADAPVNGLDQRYALRETCDIGAFEYDSIPPPVSPPDPLPPLPHQAGCAVLNQPPVANTDNYSTSEDAGLNVAAPGVLSNDNDPDGNPLTATLVGGPTKGSLTLNPNGSFTYTPNLNFNGSDSFTYKANDGALDSNAATVTITVNVLNDAPVAANDSYSINEDATLNIAAPGVLGNDSDVDSPSLTAVLVGGPTNGTLTLNGNGSFTYTPFPNFNGTDSFTYKANDGALDSNLATVTITVNAVNDAPVAANDSYTTNEDTALIVAAPGVLGNDSDVDSPSLTAVLVSGPANGTLTLNGNGSFTYTPNLNFNGTDSFTYKTNDGALDSNEATVTITVNALNDAPVAANDSYSINEDATLNIAAPGVLGNDSDVDSPSLTAVLVGGPTNGTLTLNGNGSFTYTPFPNFNGTDSFTYKANDGQADSNLATVTITVNAVNDSPTANNQAVTTPEDTPVLITLTGSDIEGSNLGFQVTVPPSHGTLADLTVTGPTTATVTYTPDPNYSGPDSFLFIVNDGAANSPEATISISVTPVNDGPMANDQTINTQEDVAVPITLTGSDPEGDPLTFTIETQPTTGTLSGTPPNLVYTPNANFNGTDSFTFSVSDGSLTSAPATVAITVEALNDAPTATGFSASTPQNTPVELTLLGSDPEGDPLTFNIVTAPANGILGPIVGNNVTYTPSYNYTGLDSFGFTVSDGSSTSAPAMVLITVTSGQFKCPLTQGYWKTHPEAWLTTFLMLGSQSYTKAELLTLLNTPVKGDASLNLAHQLIAAKLNIANGSDPAPISAVLADADSLLSGFSGKLPYNVKASTATGKAMVNDASVLDSYNNGRLTPGCVP